MKNKTMLDFLNEVSIEENHTGWYMVYDHQDYDGCNNIPQEAGMRYAKWMQEQMQPDETKTPVLKMIAESPYYPVLCQSCGWLGSSKDCDGGGQIADTGDYGDSYCPKCAQVDPDEADSNEYYIVHDSKASIYVKQIQELQSRLFEERRINDKLRLKLLTQ